MTVNQRKEGSVVILTLQGKLDLDSAPELDRVITKLIDDEVRQIVLDLSGLEYISSAGLRVLLSGAKRLRHVQGKLVLASPAPQVKKILDISGFSTILQIFDNMPDAVEKCTLSEDVHPETAKPAHFKLTVAEEIFLLALDKNHGAIRKLPDYSLDYALASALLMELELCDRIDVDLKMLKVASTAPTGEPLLDETLLELRQIKEPKTISFWLERLTAQKDEFQRQVLAQLIRKGILKQENRRILWVFEIHRYPLMDDREVKEVRTRLRELILSDDIPDARDVVLISLGSACRLLDSLFTAEEKERANSRISSLSRLDLISHALEDSIMEIERKIAIASMPSSM